MKCVTDLIDNMHTVVELQLKDLRRAIHGTGNYALCRSFYLPSRNIPGVACDVRREKGSGFLPVPGKFQQSRASQYRGAMRPKNLTSDSVHMPHNY